MRGAGEKRKPLVAQLAPGWLPGKTLNAAELNGVSFSKGCFVGQENTARMNWRQKVNRRLFVVEGDGGGKARVAYPELGLSVGHVRADARPENAIMPAWLETALI